MHEPHGKKFGCTCRPAETKWGGLSATTWCLTTPPARREPSPAPHYDMARISRLQERMLCARLSTTSPSITHCTVRSAAMATDLSKTTVGCMLTLFGVLPHRSKNLSIPTDPLFLDKVRDLSGLHLNPPDHAVVLCVDEKTQILAFERTQPVLPCRLHQQTLRKYIDHRHHKADVWRMASRPR